MNVFFGQKIMGVVTLVMSMLLLSFQQQAAGSQLTVYTVNYPLAYMAERIGGADVQVVFPVPPDTDPAYWTPDIKTIVQYQKADLILINGAGYADWLSKVSLPKSRIVNTTKAVKKRYIPIQGAMTHSHGPEGAHSHEGTAFTTWLDLDIATRQAEAIARVLIRKIPEQKENIEQNLSGLKKDLKKLDDALLTLGKTYQTTPLIGSHPVYQYLANRYGLNIKSVHWEPDQHPTSEQLSELEVLMETHQAPIMLWEDDPQDSIKQVLEELPIAVVVFNPCGNSSEEGNFIQVMQNNVKRLENTLASLQQ